MDYPINYLNTGHADNHVSDLASSHNWDSLVTYLTDHDYKIDHTRHPSKNESPPSLMTPLHFAAEGNASKEIFEKLLDLGASRCLKTDKGETAYDIGKRKCLAGHILNLIKIPENVKENEKSIYDMETSLHSLMKSNVGILACLNDNRQQLPQLAYLFDKHEMCYFFYYVPGMHGGIEVQLHEKGIHVSWYSNICSGSEESYLIERDGTLTK